MPKRIEILDLNGRKRAEGTVYLFSNVLMTFLKDHATSEERQLVKKLLDTYLEGWQMVTKPEPPTVTARALVMLTDHLVRKDKEEQKPDISCREGCAHCCHQKVMISDQEAALLIQAAESKGLTLDRAKMEAQAMIDTEWEWAKKPKAERACVFLGADNRCQVYDSRPMACRKYFAVSDPDRCDIDKHGANSLVQNWYSLPAEILCTAVMTHFGAASMPNQLLKLIKGKEEGRG